MSAPAPPSLTLVLSALSGTNMRVQPLPAPAPEALAQRPVLTPSHLLLPADYAHSTPDAASADARAQRIHRAAVAHAAAHRLYSAPACPSNTLKPLAIAVISAVEDARVERLLCTQLPGVGPWFGEFLLHPDAPHGLDAAALIARMGRVLHDTRCTDDNFWVNKSRELFEASLRHNGFEDATALRRMAGVLANDLGQMRVPFSAQRHVVPTPYRDDHSYLWDYGPSSPPPPEEAPATLRLHQTSAPRPSSTLEASAPTPTPSAATLHHYPEWDYQRARLKPDWCSVHDQALPAHRPTGTPPPHPTTCPLRQAQHPSPVQRLRRQWGGEAIDLNAAIDMQVQRRMQLPGEGRLYLRSQRRTRSASILVLLDFSASTGTASETGTGAVVPTILEVEKQSALMLLGGTARLHHRLALHGFASDTRHTVNYTRLLHFGQALHPQASAALHAMQAHHSTRLGAALRHASGFFAHERSDVHAVVLITDGAPSDIDVFDPRYLVEDARAAVRSARQQGVHCYALVLGAHTNIGTGSGEDTRAYAQRIFGQANYRTVPAAHTLPRALAALYTRLVSA